MEDRLTNLPVISTDTNYYLIKTRNGKYFEDFKSLNKVSYYPFKAEIIKKSDELTLFQSLKVNDIVLIPSYQNKQVLIGRIRMPYQILSEEIYCTVIWLKTVLTDSLFHLHKYIRGKKVILPLDAMKEEINRHLYDFYLHQDMYHGVLRVNQEEQILLRSVYGLYHLALDETKSEDLKIKMAVASPGLIEFITTSVDVFIVIIKLFHTLHLLSQNKKLEAINKKIMETYYEYGVDKLKLESPLLDEDKTVL